MSTSPHVLGLGVVSNAAIHGGEPVLQGTSTSVRAVAELWNQGVVAEQIPARMPHLELLQVFEALHYYLGHRDEIDAHIAANRIPNEWSGRRFDPASGQVQ